MTTYTVGQTANVKISITDVSNASADPTGLTVKVRKPDKSLLTFTYGSTISLVKDSVGVYHLKLLVDQPGRWTYRWEAVEPDTGVAEGFFNVQHSMVV